MFYYIRLQFIFLQNFIFLPIKKFAKILLIVMFVFLSIVLVVWGILRMPFVQHFITQKAMFFLSEQLGTDVSIKKINYNLNKTFVIKELLINDKNKDTLLYINKLKINFKNFDTKKLAINVRKIYIHNLYSNLYNVEQDSMNFSFLLKNKNQNKQEWTFSCKKITLLNSKIKHTGWQKNSNTFDKINLLFSNIYIDSSVVNVISSGGYANLNGKSFVENIGFKLNLNLNKKNYKVQHFYVSTQNSMLNLGVSSIVFDTFSNQLQKAKLKVNSSKLTLSDFYFINDALSKIKNTIRFSGNIDFDKEAIKTKNLELIFGNKSSLLANASIKHYENVNQLFYNVDFNRLFFTKNDFFSLLNDFQIDTSKIASKITSFKTLEYKGNLQGTADSLFSKGTLNSNFGLMSTNLSVKKNEGENNFLVTGNLKTLPIFLNKILNTKHVGKLNLNINTSGVYTDRNNFDFELDGEINRVQLNGYDLKSINVKGRLKNDFFEGLVACKDTNLLFDFKGIINLQDLHTYDFISNIRYADLSALGLNKNDSISELKFSVDASFLGNNLENSEGTVRINNINYKQNNKEWTSDSLQISSEYINDKKRLRLTSDFLDFYLLGEYNLIAFLKDYKIFVNQFLPFYFVVDNEDIENKPLNNFDFDVKIKDADTLTDMFLPNLNIASTTEIKGSFNSSQYRFQMACESPYIEFDGKRLKNLVIKSYTKSERLFVNMGLDELKYSERNSLKNFLTSLVFNKDTIKSNVNWNNRELKNYSGNINTDIVFITKKEGKKPQIKLDINPSHIVISDTLWNFSKSSIIKDSSGIDFQKVKVEKKDSYLKIDGKFSKNPTDSLLVDIKKIDLYYLNILLKDNELNFGGDISGKTNMRDVFGEAIIDSDFEINRLSLNEHEIGNTFLKSKWNKEAKQLDIHGYAEFNQNKTFDFSGFVATERQEMLIDLDLKQLQMSLLEVFIAPSLRNISGYLNGNVKIFKEKEKMWWGGSVFAEKAFLTVDATNVPYHFSDSVFFDDDRIIFKNIKVYDDYQNTALLNGKITHTNFSNFAYDFFITTKKILSINTTPKISPMNYGKAFGRGDVNLRGGKGENFVNVVATNLENSKYTISVEGRSDIKDNDFITFVSHKQKQGDKEYSIKKIKAEELKNNQNSKTTVNLNLTITPVADLQIILDPKIGDALKAKGNAQVNIEMTPTKLNMFGDFIIDEGTFSFSLQDIMNKRLKILQGSTVSWQGDPINALLNIDAVYELKKVSIADLTGLEEDIEKRVPVDCHLLMTNHLNNPEINFSIQALSNSNNEILEQLNSLGKDEINKQVVSLLLLNKFAPINSANTNTGINTSSSLGVTTLSEMLSNELNQWLSETNSGIDIGLTLKPRTEEKQAEYGVFLSKKLWNDRLSIYGNFEYGGKNNFSKNKNSPYSNDFSIEFKLTKKGNLRVKAYQKENDEIDEINAAPYKQGIGLFYTEEFDKFSDLLKKMFRKQYATKPKNITEKEEE